MSALDPQLYNLYTFGCKVNTYDSGLLQKKLQSAGYNLSEQGRVHVLNTCAVTREATREAVKLVRKIKAKDPFAVVVVTGCAAQVDTEQFESLKAADLIVANSHKGMLLELLDKHFRGTLEQRVFKSNIFKKEDLEMGGGEEEDHTRSFLKIQDGCNSFCTFCVIPYARGKSRSIPVTEIVSRVNELSSQGVKEVVLTGVHIGDYDDEGRSLEDLVETLLKRTKIHRFRLSSLEPVELTTRLIELYQDKRLCPHFHMSIQSANTKTLTDMKRKYTAEDVENAFNLIEKRISNAFVGMDIIAGFPGETEDDFAETYARMQSLPWTRMHVFPYSPRPGTRALKLEGHMHRSIIKSRSQRLRELSLERFKSEALKQINTMKEVLTLKGQEFEHGLSHDYWSIKVKHSLKPGQEIKVKVTKLELDQNGIFLGRLKGEVCVDEFH